MKKNPIQPTKINPTSQSTCCRKQHSAASCFTPYSCTLNNPSHLLMPLLYETSVAITRKRPCIFQPCIFQPIIPDWSPWDCCIATCHTTPPPMLWGSQILSMFPPVLPTCVVMEHFVSIWKWKTIQGCQCAKELPSLLCLHLSVFW